MKKVSWYRYKILWNFCICNTRYKILYQRYFLKKYLTQVWKHASILLSSSKFKAMYGTWEPNSKMIHPTCVSRMIQPTLILALSSSELQLILMVSLVWLKASLTKPRKFWLLLKLRTHLPASGYEARAEWITMTHRARRKTALWLLTAINSKKNVANFTNILVFSGQPKVA